MKSKPSILTQLLLVLALCLIGMSATYIAGNALTETPKAFSPSLFILLRNILILSGFPLLYFLLRFWRFKGDWELLVVMTVLVGVGLTMQYRIQAQLISSDDLQFLISEEGKVEIAAAIVHSIRGGFRTLIIYGLAFTGLIAVYRLFRRVERLTLLRRRYMLLFVLLGLFLGILVMLSKVDSDGRFVYRTTPWEIFKVGLIIVLAGYLADFRRSLSRPFPPLIVWGPVAFFIFGIPMIFFILLGDFGQILIYTGLIIAMFFIATKQINYLLLGLISLTFALFAIANFAQFFPGHVFTRFDIWQNLWGNMDNSNWWDTRYQLVNVLFALDSGNLFGTNLGMGSPTAIPLVVSDMIYAAIAEELGFVGCFLVLLTYFYLICKGMLIAQNAKNNTFAQLIAAGCTALIGIQTFINVGGTIKLIPMTGITLPFISHGGFSLITNFIIIGLLLAISHQNVTEESPQEITQSFFEGALTPKERGFWGF